MTNPILLVTEDLRKGTQLEINAQGIRIGRDPNNELHLDDPEVSRHHARVILHNGAVWVQDAGSRNGIFVNGNRVSGHKQISPGARIPSSCPPDLHGCRVASWAGLETEGQ